MAETTPVPMGDPCSQGHYPKLTIVDDNVWSTKLAFNFAKDFGDGLWIGEICFETEGRVCLHLVLDCTGHTGNLPSLGSEFLGDREANICSSAEHKCNM